jgi:peptide deformylase
MALLEVIQMPNPALKKPSRKVTHVDDELRQLAADMAETMVKYDGVGLAAIQVGVPKRLILVRVPEIVEEKVDVADAEAILKGDDAEPKKGIFKITVEKPDDPEAGSVVTYIRRKIIWSEPFVCINPRIVEKEGLVIDDEGCLSDMGYLAKVERARKVVVVGYDIDMKPIRRETAGLEARCLQHEIDHLDGILYTDRMMEDTRRKVAGADDGEEEGPVTDDSNIEEIIAKK